MGHRRLHRHGHHRGVARLRRDLCPRRPRHRRDGAMTAEAMALDLPRRSRMSFGRFISLLIIALLIIWTAVPLFMAVMWSLVDPDNPWSPPAVLPPSLSLAQWEYVFQYSNIVGAVGTSFLLAPIVTLASFILALPTAYAIARYNFWGKEALKLLILLPIVMPGMVIAMFLSRVFVGFGLAQTFI